MQRKIFSLAGMFFLLAMAHGLAEAPETAPVTSIPAATRSEVECSGFIVANPVPTDVYVFDGADNDFRSPYHEFTTGKFVYLRSGKKQNIAAGTEYRLVRPATISVFGEILYDGLGPIRSFGHNSRYPGQGRAMRSLGHAYEDIGKVNVVADTPAGAVAEVTFSCGPIVLGDIAMPFQTREIPAYTPSAHFDPFALPEGKLTGFITAGAGNTGQLRAGSLVYVNLGEQTGARPGQRYRIFHVDRIRSIRWMAGPEPPTESLGELVILSTQERASVAIVVSTTREASAGDGVVLE